MRWHLMYSGEFFQTLILLRFLNFIKKIHGAIVTKPVAEKSVVVHANQQFYAYESNGRF